MDRADYALKLMADGKLNFAMGKKNLEMEQMKLKNFRNNIVISFLICNCLFISIFNTMTIKNKKILIIVGGGIAAYKSLDLIRLLKKNNNEVKAILTKSGKIYHYQ